MVGLYTLIKALGGYADAIRRVIGRQSPACLISSDVQAVLYPQMAAQGLRAKSAFETHNMVRPHRAADWNRGQRCRAGPGSPPKSDQHALHRRNQIPELVDSDTVLTIQLRTISAIRFALTF
jgi:hypothetical protein